MDDLVAPNFMLPLRRSPVAHLKSTTRISRHLANNTKKRPPSINDGGLINLAITYSRGTYSPTTIGYLELNGRVRNGNG